MRGNGDGLNVGLGQGWNSLRPCRDCGVLRYGDRRYRDEFWESAYRKWTAGGSEELALEALPGCSPEGPEMGL